MQSGVGDTGEAIYLTQTNNPYIQDVSIRQHITKKTPEIVYLNLRKASIIRVMAILPNSPVLGGVEVISPITALKRFSMSAKLRYSRTATIKL